MSYTNGEFKALLAPVLGVDAADIAAMIVVAKTKDGTILNNAMRDRDVVDEREIYIDMLGRVMAGIIHDEMRENLT